MKKLLILQRVIAHYRIPIWNIIAEKYNLTIGYFENDFSANKDCKFSVKKFDYNKIGPFIWVRNLRQFAKQFEVVCFMPDPHVLSYVSLPFLPHAYKLLTWSIGFRCSYIHPYALKRKHTLMDKVYSSIYNSVDANDFYMKQALEFWRDSEIDKSKVFIAPNTTAVEPIVVNPNPKKNILFVGTLYKGKGVDLLIKAFGDAISYTHANMKLIVVGKGEMKGELEHLVSDAKLEKYVEFTGAIYDESLLASYFQKALLCVSPLQGGLTCPKSMGYGVPFVCRKDAITGGEIYHMKNGVSGIMYDNNDELVDILKDSMINPHKYIEMGLSAKEYYDKFATPRCAAKGFIDALDSVFESK